MLIRRIIRFYNTEIVTAGGSKTIYQAASALWSVFGEHLEFWFVQAIPLARFLFQFSYKILPY
jgi:hypothetical protein